MPFRSDILRGVRLFLIAFAAILLCLLAYQVLRPTAAAQSAPQAAAAPVQNAPAAEEAPSPEPHPLVVPPPPPVVGEAPAAPLPVKVSRPRRVDTSVPPPPPVAPARSSRTASRAPEPREYPAPGPGTSSAPPAVPEASPAPGGVGYKSLMEADPNQPPAEAAPQPSSTPPEPVRKPEGNRIKRGLGRILRLGRKDTTQP